MANSTHLTGLVKGECPRRIAARIGTEPRHEVPASNIRHPEERQNPTSNLDRSATRLATRIPGRTGGLGTATSCFFGYWILDLGAYWPLP